MGRIILTILIILLMKSNIFAYTKTQQFNLDKEGDSNGYELVFVICGEASCDLVCQVPGTLECDFWTALETGCEGCQSEQGLFGRSKAQDMFDYAEDQISSNNYSGTYYSNFVDIHTSMKYYRTVVWSYNSSTEMKDIDVTITETDEY